MGQAATRVLPGTRRRPYVVPGRCRGGGATGRDSQGAEDHFLGRLVGPFGFWQQRFHRPAGGKGEARRLGAVVTSLPCGMLLITASGSGSSGPVGHTVAQHRRSSASASRAGTIQHPARRRMVIAIVTIEVDYGRWWCMPSEELDWVDHVTTMMMRIPLGGGHSDQLQRYRSAIDARDHWKVNMNSREWESGNGSSGMGNDAE